MQSVVSVCTRWGDYVLSVRDVRRGESLSVGSPPQRLLSFQSGTPSVCVHQSGRAEQQCALGPGESVTVTRDGLDYTLSCSGADETPSFAAHGRRWALGDVLALGLLCAALGWRVTPTVALVPAPAQAPAEPAQQQLLAPEELSMSHHAMFVVVAEPLAEPLQLGEMRCGNAEPGSHIAADTTGRYGMAGPHDNPDPHVSRPVIGQGFPTAYGGSGELGIPQAQSGSVGPTAPWGRNTSLGSDDKSARGVMWSEELDEQLGQEEFGFARRPGGVVKAFDLAPLADERPGELRVVHTGLRVTGPRKPSEVARALAAHFDEFRACGQGSAPPDAARVQLELDVAADGRASATTSGNSALEQCVTQSLAHVSFAPGANAATHVVYPLRFTVPTAAVHTPQAAPTVAAPCDCG